MKQKTDNKWKRSSGDDEQRGQKLFKVGIIALSNVYFEGKLDLLFAGALGRCFFNQPFIGLCQRPEAALLIAVYYHIKIYICVCRTHTKIVLVQGRVPVFVAWIFNFRRANLVQH